MRGTCLITLWFFEFGNCTKDKKKKQTLLKRILIEDEIDIIALQESKIENEEQADRMINMFKAYYDVCVCHAVGSS